MAEIYRLRSTTVDDRPTVDFTLDCNRANDWDLVDLIARGVSPVSAVELHLRIDHAAWSSMGLYMLPGTLGLFHNRIGRLIEEAAASFEYIDAWLNGVSYVVPVSKTPSGCLDIDRSRVKRFDFPPFRIYEIEVYAFFSELVEPVYTLDCGQKDLFVTNAVKEAIQSTGLDGFDFSLLWRQ